MRDDQNLIRKHRGRGVLIDTNLLVLYLVGKVNRNRITQFKRTRNFSASDFDLLVQLVSWFGRLFATPHLLTETSNLADLPAAEGAKVRFLFRTLVEQIGEFYDPSSRLVANKLFDRFGLTDVAIGETCRRGILVLTADVRLHDALQRESPSLDVLNFNHIRSQGWTTV